MWLIVVGLIFLGIAAYYYLANNERKELPQVAALKGGMYILAVALWGGAAYFFYNIGNTHGWESVSYLAFSIGLLVGGIKVVKAAYNADPKIASDMEARARTETQRVEKEKKLAELEVAKELARIRLETERIRAEDEQRRIPFEMEREYQTRIAQYQLNMRTIENQIASLTAATALGVSPTTREQLIVERERQNLELEAQRSAMLLEVAKSQLLKKVDFEFEQMMAGLEEKFAFIKRLMPQHELIQLNKQLSGLYQELNSILQTNDDLLKKQETTRIKRQIRSLEAEVNERQKRSR